MVGERDSDRQTDKTDMTDKIRGLHKKINIPEYA